MDYRNVLPLALVAVLLVPVASAYAPAMNSAPDAGETAPQGLAPSEAPADTDEADDGNYTRLYFVDGYKWAEVKPGESTTFDITVGNSDDETVELNPHFVTPQARGRPIDESWVSIEDGDTTLEPDEERTFTVTVDVPNDAELSDYSGQVAFTNQTVSYDGGPDRPVHAVSISVEVYKEPSVEITGERYGRAQIRTGESYTYSYTIENTGDQAVPVNPQIQLRERHGPGDSSQVERSWFEIDAPNEVGPGETATVNVTVTPPADADLGTHRVEVDLGLKDPNRPDRGDYWQRVHLYFQVWEQPDEPFTKTFSVSEDAENVTLKLQAGGHYGMQNSDDPAGFDVTFVSPSGERIDAERVRVTDRGYVDLASEETDGTYGARGDSTEFVYRVDDPAAGEWTVEIMPQNTINFQYQIIRDESGD